MTSRWAIPVARRGRGGGGGGVESRVFSVRFPFAGWRRCAPGKLDHEGRARADCAVYKDCSPQRLDHLAGEPESEAETRSLLDRGCPLEFLEAAVLILWGDTDSIVLDFEPGPGRGRPQGDRDRLSMTVLHGVREQVGED